MNNQIESIVKELGLQPHPEGGFYSETYRSEMSIPGMERQLMTAIYFLLTSENVSNFHRIKSDELWFYHAGSPLTVHTLDQNGHSEIKIGPDFAAGQRPQALVKSGIIFGSSVDVEDGYSLVSCVVAPGFDFRDFELFERQQLKEMFPGHEAIITRLTPDH